VAQGLNGPRSIGSDIAIVGPASPESTQAAGTTCGVVLDPLCDAQGRMVETLRSCILGEGVSSFSFRSLSERCW